MSTRTRYGMGSLLTGAASVMLLFAPPVANSIDGRIAVIIGLLSMSMIGIGLYACLSDRSNW